MSTQPQAEALHAVLTHLTAAFPGFAPLTMEGYEDFRAEFLTIHDNLGRYAAFIYADEFCARYVLRHSEEATETAVDHALDVWKQAPPKAKRRQEVA